MSEENSEDRKEKGDKDSMQVKAKDAVNLKDKGNRKSMNCTAIYT